MKHRNLRVTVCNRDFYIKLVGKKYYVEFAPPPAVRAALGITRVLRTTGFGIGFEEPAKAKAEKIVREHFPDEQGQVAAIEQAEAEKLKFASLGEIADRYRDGARLVKNKEDIKLSTINANINALAMIVETRFDKDGNRSRVEGRWGKMVFECGKNLARVFEEFGEGWLRSAGQSEVARDRAKRSINSYIAFARSLFGKDYLHLYTDLRLPDLGPLLALRKYKIAEKPKFEGIDPRILGRMESEIRTMRQERPDWYLAYWWMRKLGLRRGEVMNARLGWIQRTNSSVKIAIVKREDPEFTPKGRPGALRVHPHLMQETLELSNARHRTDRLIPITQDSMAAFSKWLAAHLGKGSDRRSLKTGHELRKQAISEVLVLLNGNVYKTLEFSRHKDIQTLLDHYVTDVSADQPMLEMDQTLRVLPDAKAAVA